MRTILATLLVALSILGVGSKVFAGLLSFDFRGPCVSVGGDGCNAFGLIDGDTVTGTLAIEEILVVPGERLILNPPLINFEFSFTFGNFTVSKTDIGDAAMEVFFLPPDASELNALSAPIPPGPYMDGSKFILLSPANLVIAEQVFAVSRNSAQAVGSWLRRPERVPEPATPILLAFGLVAIGLSRRFKARGRMALDISVVPAVNDAH